jgi:choice-of-anchor B domain-containing protein
MTRLALTLASAALLVPAAGAQSLNMSLVGRVDPRSQGYSDVWGYVASDGREYAVVSTRSDGGTTVIDVTAVPPVEVKFIPGSGGTGSDVELYGDYAYVSDDQAVVQIIDLSDPANAAVVATFEADPGQPTAGVHTLTVAGDYLYTQGGGDPGGVRIWSLANPIAPAYVGEYQPHYIHDIMVRGDTLWGAGIYGDGVDIVDISNRAAPTLINRFNYPGSGAHNVCATTDGSYVFVGDEIGSGQWTRVFDVRDPMNPELVASIIVDATSTVHNCHVVGDLIYIAHYDRGARVWDISNPEAPFEVAYYETNVSLMWSVYPHLPSGRLIASDMQQGLFVLEFAGTATAPGAEQDPFAMAVVPNPIREDGVVRFSLPVAADTRLALYDVTGREVAVLSDGMRPAGTHTASVAADALPPGVYVVRLVTDAGVATRRLTIAR